MKKSVLKFVALSCVLTMLLGMTALAAPSSSTDGSSNNSGSGSSSSSSTSTTTTPATTTPATTTPADTTPAEVPVEQQPAAEYASGVTATAEVIVNGEVVAVALDVAPVSNAQSAAIAETVTAYVAANTAASGGGTVTPVVLKVLYLI